MKRPCQIDFDAQGDNLFQHGNPESFRDHMATKKQIIII